MHASNKIYAQKLLEQDVSDETVKSILDNKHAMFDAMGVMQHHDAITGTARQAVADSYMTLLTNARETNDKLYAELVGEKSAKAGLDSNLEWSTCQISSTTPVDCGLETSDEAKSYVITVHNPSTVT